jgi:carboxypeptidase C (cathepsin A)
LRSKGVDFVGTKKLAGLTIAAMLLAAAAASAQDHPGDGKKPAGEPPKTEQSVTQHSISIGGKTISYNATAGTLLVRNDKDEPTAAMGYIAYVQHAAGESGDAGRRPITFAYNGGPGSSSVWLHMGALGPRRIITADASPTLPPPYRVVDNAYSLHVKTDLVMIDPVGTGLSHAVGEAKDKDFWGVDPDIESISRFITQYVNDNHRWGSPKYLLGESYGSTRSAGIVDYLQTKSHMAFNGVILVSVALDLEAVFPLPGVDKSYPLFLPTYAATAWYHHTLPRQPAALEPFLDEVRGFAMGEYAAALMKGDALSDAESDAVAEKIHQYTGPVRRLREEGEAAGPREPVHPGADAERSRDRRPPRLPLHRRQLRPAGRGHELRSAVGGHRGPLHGGVPGLPAFRSEIRAGPDLQH